MNAIPARTFCVSPSSRATLQVIPERGESASIQTSFVRPRKALCHRHPTVKSATATSGRRQPTVKSATGTSGRPQPTVKSAAATSGRRQQTVKSAAATSGRRQQTVFSASQTCQGKPSPSSEGDFASHAGAVVCVCAQRNQSKEQDAPYSMANGPPVGAVNISQVSKTGYEYQSVGHEGWPTVQRWPAGAVKIRRSRSIVYEYQSLTKRLTSG